LSRIAREILIDGFPDLICLQEVSRNYPATDNGSDQVAELEKFFPEYESFFGASHDRSGGFNGGRRQFGNLVLTRHSPIQVLHHLLPSPADPKVKFMSRQTTELVIPTSSGAFRMMNTHLEFFSEKQQLSQVQRIRELHEEACIQYNEPGLDLPNTPFESAPFPDKIPDLFDAWNVVNPDGNRSPTCGVFDHKQWKNGPHCRDYFFLSENFLQQIQNVSVNTDTNASDHQPIRLTLKV